MVSYRKMRFSVFFCLVNLCVLTSQKMKLCSSCGVTEARRAGVRKHQAFGWGDVFDAVLVDGHGHGHGVVRSELNRFE